VLVSVCRRLLDQFRQPVLIERFLPGREFTVGILGTGDAAKVLGTLEIVLNANAEPGVYSYVNKERCEDLVEYRLVPAAGDSPVAQAEQIALAAWRIVGGRDAGRIDLRCDELGRPQLIEINPLAGLHPTHSDLPMLWTATGGEYADLVGRIVASAESRLVRGAAKLEVVVASRCRY
jgi:D-alanine-D-alanine ligase